MSAQIKQQPPVSAEPATLVRGLDLAMVGLMTAIPWTALIVSESFYFPFVTPRAYVFRLMVQAMAIGWAVLVTLDPRRLPRWSAVLLAYLGLTAVALAADLLSDHPSHSLLGDLERMGGFAATAHFAALLLVAVTVLGSLKRWRLVFISSLMASAVAAARALLQVFEILPLEHVSGRVDGGFGNPTYLAGYLLAHVFAAAYLFVGTRPSRPLAVAFVAIACLDIGAIVATGNRSAMLGLVVGVGVAAVARIPHRRPRRVVVGAVVLAAVVSGAVVSALPPDVTTGFEPVDRVLNTSLTETTTRSRLLVWRIAVEGFLDRPLTGWGEESFLTLFYRHFDPELWYQSNQVFDRPHNTPLQWLTATGIFGLLAYLAVYAGAAAGIRRSGVDRPVRAVLAGWLVAHFVHTLFVFDDLIGAMVFVLLLGLIHTLGAEESVKTLQPRAITVAAALGAVALAALGLHSTVREPARAERSLVAGVQALATDPARSLEAFETAAAASPMAAPFACDRLLEAVSGLVETPGITDESRTRIAAGAREVVEIHLERNPLDLTRRLALVRFLDRIGDPEAAISHLVIARDQAPNRPDVHLQLANAEFRLGRMLPALESARAAFHLVPRDQATRTFLALVAIYGERNELAAQILIEDHGTELVADGRVVAARAATGDFAAVVATVAHVPQDRAKHRVYIAEIAIVEIQRAAAGRPEWQTQAEAAVTEIRGMVP